MMANMNMIDNMAQLQNLMNLKMQLANIEAQYNLILTNMQNIGLTPDSYTNLNNVSFQFINFGIQLLNIGIPRSNNILNNINLNQQIDNIIINLNSIKLTNPFSMNQNMNMMNFKNINENAELNNNKPKYNVKFVSDLGKITLIVCDMDITLDELIKMLLIRIGRNELIGREQMEFVFLYNGHKINTMEKKSKKLNEIFFESRDNIKISYFKPKSLTN